MRVKSAEKRRRAAWAVGWCMPELGLVAVTCGKQPAV